MNNNHTLAQAKAVLAKDIIERSDRTFVYQGMSDRAGWEKGLPVGGSYSEFLLKPRNVKEALANTYRFASNLLSAMRIPKKVHIEVSHFEDSGWTDSKSVHVSTKYFDNPRLSIGQKMDIFCGIAIHEGSHLLHTVFDCPQNMSEFAMDLENIIEDERIEHLCGEEMPGLANFLSVTKWYFFKMYEQLNPEEKKKVSKPLDDASRMVNAVLKLIRYRAALTEKEMEEFADVLIEAHDCMIPYPQSPAEVRRKALELEAILRKYMQEPPQPKQQDRRDQPSGESGNPGQDDQKNSSSQQNNPSESSGSNTVSGEESDGKTDPQENTDGQSQAPSQGGGHGLGLSPDQVEDVLKKLGEAMKQITSKPGQELGEDGEDECQVIQDDESLNKVLSGKYEPTDISNTFFQKVDSNGDVNSGVYYRESLARVRSAVPAMRNILKANATEDRRTLTGLRSGMLDTNLLASAFQGVQTVYRQTQSAKANPIAVCVLIDQSGSMCGTKIKKARDTAVLIDAALDSLPGVELYMYGFTSNYNTDKILVYREAGRKDINNLGLICEIGGTPIGEALLAARDRIRKHSSSKCLLFMITDGATTGEENVRKAVKTLERDNFIPVAIGIENGLSLKEDFDKAVSLTDIRTLPRDLGKLIQKAILENARRQVGA